MNRIRDRLDVRLGSLLGHATVRLALFASSPGWRLGVEVRAGRLRRTYHRALLARAAAGGSGSPAAAVGWVYVQRIELVASFMTPMCPQALVLVQL